ncbi:chemotaxis protein CheW [Silvanigrella aquatica]|uniref:CheW-like domain-containing protein n=1 Tax=Silvanigrella aquatica TaxID=1915309 RepID=A0A1L4CYW1_9BACT|nr:chemotaxis protein CheW [Silvanigrella aquatica]APJ03125.1 hypothetical protein AXG55_04065 [Silvanigrella aquatica]
MTEDIKNSNQLFGNDNRYLCFSLGSEQFSIPLLQVKEVIGIPEFTPIPFTPNYFCGIMNLRGKVISVIDLRKKLNIPSKGKEENSVIVCDLSSITIGALVDSVDNVINIEKEKILPKPEMQSSIKNDYIDGLIEFKNNLIVLVNLAKTLSVEDLVYIENK